MSDEFPGNLIGGPDASHTWEPYGTLLEHEQRRLAEIGGRPCEWGAAEWARWNMKEVEDVGTNSSDSNGR